MATRPEDLIEKFAEMIEEADQLDDRGFAEKTVDILIMLSMMEDSVSTMEKINQKIHSLIVQADDIKSQGKSQQYVANQMRELKESSHHVGLMH
ncbi:MAG: hypothetical protein BGO43_03850 [Gammaproteobacteria bacterium 39-13]|nr:hypothetical protein [Gammaproteobacteria bacterium]OJV96006.1 MAG: hypothetical protein BGO43_03850 [Gammaproteobacteria bacterium 39-13]